MKLANRTLHSGGILFLLSLVFFITSCRKSVETNIVVENSFISLKEMKSYANSLSSRLKDQPIFQFEKAMQKQIDGKMYVSVPISGLGAESGSFYFTKSSDGRLHSLYVAIDQKDKSKLDANIGFVDFDNKEFTVATYRNNKLDALFTIKDKNNFFSDAFVTLTGSGEIIRSNDACTEQVTLIKLANGTDSVIYKKVNDSGIPCPGTKTFWQKIMSFLNDIWAGITDAFDTIFGWMGGSGGSGSNSLSTSGSYGSAGFSNWDLTGFNGSWFGGCTSCASDFTGTSWGPYTDPTISNMSFNFMEFDATVDYASAVSYKTFYSQLVGFYSTKPADQYTLMSNQEFIQYIQQNPSLIPTIDPITILVKAGVNGSVDILTQVLFNKLLMPGINTWSEAFASVNWLQVGSTVLTGFLPWRTPGGKAVTAAINGATAALSEITANGFTSWNRTGLAFTEGFCASVVATSLSDVIARFGSKENFGKALIEKLDNSFSYGTICKWFGGGLTSISKTYTNRVIRNGVLVDINISVKRVMQGWADKKIAVIGRSMDDRVKYFAQQLKNELGNDYTIITFNPDPNWSPDQLFSENKKFIDLLKSLGYSFYDIGLDDTFPLTGDDLIDYGKYYLMEIMEIFNSK